MNIRIECVRPVIGSAAFDSCITSHYIIRLTRIRAFQPALLITKEYNLPSDSLIDKLQFSTILIETDDGFETDRRVLSL
jgi:hypothetical protein